MSRDGYTLIEVLVALAILGFAIAGVAQAVHAVGVSERKIAERLADDQARRTVSLALTELLDGYGPFATQPSEGVLLKGDAQKFEFPCDVDRVCGAALRPSSGGGVIAIQQAAHVRAIRIPNWLAPLHFQYQGAQSTAAWPASSSERQTLRAIYLVDAKDQIVALVDIWAEEEVDCQFDPIEKACRRRSL